MFISLKQNLFWASCLWAYVSVSRKLVVFYTDMKDTNSVAFLYGWWKWELERRLCSNYDYPHFTGNVKLSCKLNHICWFLDLHKGIVEEGLHETQKFTFKYLLSWALNFTFHSDIDTFFSGKCFILCIIIHSLLVTWVTRRDLLSRK